MNKAVSLFRSTDHYEGILTSLHPFTEDLKSTLSNVSSIVIKINLVITRTKAYNKGVDLAVTPFKAVQAFIDFIAPFYKGKITIVEEAAWGDTKEGFRMYGYDRLAERTDVRIELRDYENDETIRKTIHYPEGTLELPFNKTIMEAPFIVSITRPKTHCSVVMTAGIKNVLVGAIHKYSMRRQIHREHMIHYILASIADHIYPHFVVIDGTVGMENGGPVRGTAINSGWVLSSFDALAADSMTAYLMGIDLEDIGYLSLLKEKKMGQCYPFDDIEIIGDQPDDLAIKFKMHRNFKNLKMWRESTDNFKKN